MRMKLSQAVWTFILSGGLGAGVAMSQGATSTVSAQDDTTIQVGGVYLERADLEGEIEEKMFVDGGTVDASSTDLTDGLAGAMLYDNDWGGWMLYLNTAKEADAKAVVLEKVGPDHGFKNPIYAAGQACLRGAGASCASSATENACFNGSGTDFCASLERVRVISQGAGCNATNGYGLVFTMFAGSRNPSEQNSGESGIEPGCDCDDSTSADGCVWISGK
jgi:hypothetical protein